jgi:hypothetical protein
MLTPKNFKKSILILHSRNVFRYVNIRIMISSTSFRGVRGRIRNITPLLFQCHHLHVVQSVTTYIVVQWPCICGTTNISIVQDNKTGSDLGIPTYTCIYLLTPWCRIVFEKLIVNQLFKQQPAFFMEAEGSLWRSQKSTTGPHPATTESSSPDLSLIPKVYLNVILPPMPSLPSGFLPSGLPTKTL